MSQRSSVDIDSHLAAPVRHDKAIEQGPIVWFVSLGRLHLVDAHITGVGLRRRPEMALPAIAAIRMAPPKSV